MEVNFGVQARDGAISVQLGDEEADDLRKKLEEAFKKGDGKLFWVTDKDGRTVGIPIDKLAFVEFSAKASRQVGFSSAS
jgi:hypothetical protein